MEKKHGFHHANDKTLRSVLQSKKAFMQLLRYMLDEDWTRRIDEQTLTRIDKSFVLNDFSALEADIVYRCKIDGQDTVFYVLLELQSTVDHQMSWRLLQYMVEIWRSLLKDEQPAQRRRSGFRMPAIVPVVLYVGSPVWSAKKSFREYLGNGSIFGKNVIDFHYHLVDVRRFSKERLTEQEGILPLVLQLEQVTKSGNLLALLENSIEAFGKLDEEELGFVSEYMRRVLLQISDVQTVKKIEKKLNPLKGGSEMVSNVVKVLRKELRQQKKEGLQEGLLEGRMEGRMEGRAEGLREGEQKERIAMISRMKERGLSVEEISELTGLPQDELNQIIVAKSTTDPS